MLVVAKPRCGGKTTDIIELALKGDSYIVCMDMAEVQRVWGIIRERKLNLPQPITWREFVENKYFGGGIRSFVIDNLDMCIQSMSPVPIVAISVTGSTRTEINKEKRKKNESTTEKDDNAYRNSRIRDRNTNEYELLLRQSVQE